MRVARSTRALLVVLAIGITGCGGAGSSSSSSGKAPGPKLGAANSPEVKTLLRKTFGSNSKATSGNISGVIDITVKGLPRYKEPIEVSVVGPFTDAGGTPEAMFDLSLGLRGGILGGDLYLKGNQAFIGLGSTAFLLPAAVATPLRAPLTQRGNALAAVLGVFHISPAHWAKDPRIVGKVRVAGIDTVHATAQIDATAFFLDVAALAKQLTSLQIAQITGLPQVVDRPAREALARSVKSATGDIYTGADDDVLRRAQINMLLQPSAKDRGILGGFTSIKVSGQLDVTDVGTPQKVTVPSARGSYPNLQISLRALAANIR